MNECKVLALGIDAAEVTLVDALCQAGKLPALQALRERGCYGVLGAHPPGFLSMVWPTFYNSTTVGHHGWYFNKMWRPDRMRLEITGPDWLPQRPFWEDLEGRRVALLDVPYGLPGSGGWGADLALNGWQSHDDFGRVCHPSDLWRRLTSRFGRPAFPAELFGSQSAGTLLALRRQMLAATEQMGRIASGLLAEGPWDLFLMVLGTAHRGGHYLWDLSMIDGGSLTPETRGTLEGGLIDIYQACDRVVGRLVDAAPGSRVLVFSLHGMGSNAGWAERLPALARRLQHGADGDGPRTGAIYRLKRALPWKLVRQVTTRLPSRLNHALVPLWSARMFDWKRTRFFALPQDVSGYFRVNLRGREAGGVVEPGREYEALCRELREAILAFRTIETGEPVARAVVLTDELVGADSPRRHLLPDLIVLWSEVPSRGCSGIRSRRHGEIRWERGEPLPSGRAGNHLDKGWFVAAGPGVPSAARADGHDILDLAPTLFAWLGARPPKRFEGRPIPALASPCGAPGGPRGS